MPFIGPWEIALILAIVLIVFGPKKLPELAKSMGDAIRQYKAATEGGGGPMPSIQSQTALTHSRSGDVLLETAKKLGIQTEGKTMEQISKEITEQASQKKSTTQLTTTSSGEQTNAPDS
jgi:sec-independent protein translocase protein TatA